MSRFKWNIYPQLTEDQLKWAGKIPHVVAQILYNRGVTDLSSCDQFLKIDEHLAGDPFLLPDMEKAVIRIFQALLSGETIVVYGDYDCDGITSTAILVRGLSALGGKVRPYIPHRLLEGYGLKSEALEKLKKEGTGLIITCDCGITALSEVKRAHRLGLDIIITDHHMPLEELPRAVASINPHRLDSKYPFSHLSGAGVAYKLLQALYTSLARIMETDNLLDLVALGTVADMVPLVGENRLFVKQGIELINSIPRTGIRELLLQARVSGEIDAGRISWILAPRLNTPGRLEHAMASFKLLMTDSAEEAREISVWLEQKNSERQKLTADAFNKAKEKVREEGLAPVIFVADDDFPVGVAGLVANRLADEFYRPVFVIHTGEVWSTGSARSIPEFNIINALQKCRNLLVHFGGHARAAGFTISTAKLLHLKKALIDQAEVELAGVDLRPHLDIDTVTSLTSLGTGSVFQYIQQLEPFGEGNPEPVFLSKGVTVVDCRTMGPNGEHLRLKVKQNDSVWDAVGFGLGEYINQINTPLDIVYNLELDKWNGREALRLNILDLS